MKGNNLVQAARKLARGKIILILICFKLCASIPCYSQAFREQTFLCFSFCFSSELLPKNNQDHFTAFQQRPISANQGNNIDSLGAHTHTQTTVAFAACLKTEDFRQVIRVLPVSGHQVTLLCLYMYVFCFKPRTRITLEKNCSKREQTNPNG